MGRRARARARRGEPAPVEMRVSDEWLRLLRLRIFGINEEGGLDDAGELLACVRDPQFHGWLIAMRDIDAVGQPLLLAASRNPEFLARLLARRQAEMLLAVEPGSMARAALRA